MNARFFLLPVALLALFAAGCDSTSIPEGPGLQGSPTAPTASAHAVSGPGQVAPYCSAVYTFVPDGTLALPINPYWDISGGATITSSTSSTANIYTGGTVGGFTLYFKDGSGAVMASTNVLIRPNGYCGPD